MILVQYPSGFGLSSLSPFCMKVEAYLKLCSLDYSIQLTSNPRLGPYGKMPVLLDQGEILPDSRCIIDYIHKKTEGGCDKHLSVHQKAIGHALQRTFEEHLYFAIMYSRWVDPIGYKVCSQEFKILFPLNLGTLALPLIRRNMMHQCKAQGLGRLEPHKIYNLALSDLSALENLLEGPFLFGIQPTSFDASIFAFLATIQAFPIQNPLKEAISTSKKIEIFLKQMEYILENSKFCTKLNI